MVAPYARTGISTVFGTSAFEYGKNEGAVPNDPNRMFFRSIYSFDSDATSVQALSDSMHRVGSLASVAASGAVPEPYSGPPNGAVAESQQDALREAKLSCRFAIYRDVLDEAVADIPSSQPTPGQLQYLDYEETDFLGMVSATRGLLDMQTCIFGAGPGPGVPVSPYGRIPRVFSVAMDERTLRMQPGDSWSSGAEDLPQAFRLQYNGAPATGGNNLTYAMTDGSDGNPPVFLEQAIASGAVPPVPSSSAADIDAWVAANSRNFPFVGIYFDTVGESADNAILDFTLSHSLGMAGS